MPLSFSLYARRLVPSSEAVLFINLLRASVRSYMPRDTVLNRIKNGELNFLITSDANRVEFNEQSETIEIPLSHFADYFELADNVIFALSLAELKYSDEGRDLNLSKSKALAHDLAAECLKSVRTYVNAVISDKEDKSIWNDALDVLIARRTFWSSRGSLGHLLIESRNYIMSSVEVRDEKKPNSVEAEKLRFLFSSIVRTLLDLRIDVPLTFAMARTDKNAEIVTAISVKDDMIVSDGETVKAEYGYLLDETCATIDQAFENSLKLVFELEKNIELFGTGSVSEKQVRMERIKSSYDKCAITWFNCSEAHEKYSLNYGEAGSKAFLQY